MPLQGQLVEEVRGLLGKTLSVSLVLSTHSFDIKGHTSITYLRHSCLAFNVDVQKGLRSQIPESLGQEQRHGLIFPQNARHLQPL